MAELRHVIVKLGLGLRIPVHSVIEIRLLAADNQFVIVGEQVLQFPLQVGYHLPSLIICHVLDLLEMRQLRWLHVLLLK